MQTILRSLSRTRNAACALLATLAAVAPGATVSLADVQPHATMLRFPDVGTTHITFVYANDIWVVSRDGGLAKPLASPPGMEMFPKFSPDGTQIAFVGNYDGNSDIYVVPMHGGIPTRVTHHPGAETLNGWTPDGESLIFHMSGLGGLTRQTQLFTVPATGGNFEQLPVPYGAVGAISPDGQWLAYTPHTRDFRTWKRHRGGMATDIWLFNLNDNTSRRATEWEGTDTIPMWHGDTLYYLSDGGPEHRLNIWSYNPRSGQRRQLTRFSEFDVKWPSIGPGPRGTGEIVFQYGKDLYLYDIRAGTSRIVEVIIPGARPTIRERAVDVRSSITNSDISPSARRVVVEARGDIWTLPAEHGSPRNMTRTSGVAERNPAWSPDGRWIAYFSDETGEYELYIMQSDGRGEVKQLTSDSDGFLFAPNWSPNSEVIAFTDKAGNLFLHTIESGETILADRDPWGSPQSVNWSHDSNWITWARGGEDTQNSSVYVYNLESGEKHRLTDPMFSSQNPVFDRKGDFLYFSSNRRFSPMYGELDTSFIYGATEVLLVAPLREDVKSPWLPKSDEEEWKKEETKKDDENGDENGEGNGDEADDAPPAPDDGVSGTWEGTLTGPEPVPPGGMPFTLNLNLADDGSLTGALNTALGGGPLTSGTYDKASGRIAFTVTIPGGPAVMGAGTITGSDVAGTLTVAELGVTASFTAKRTAVAGDGAGATPATIAKARETVEIDVEGFERRAMLIPVPNGNFGSLSVNDRGDLLYVRRGFRGSNETPSIRLFSINDEKKEEKTVATGAGSYTMTADGKKILVRQGSNLSIQDASAGASGKPVVTAGMTAMIDPREEWTQLFHDAWRIMRDYFYDPNLHMVDWPAVRDTYATMLVDCVTREDVGYVIAEMISELNVGHAYYREGDVERGPRVTVGMLGADYELHDGAYRFARIYEGAEWDADARGPLSEPGVDVNEGDYLLAVNGAPVDTSKDPWAAFQGMAGRTVTITVSDTPEWNDEARDVVVTLLSNEVNLRYRAWIEANRQYVYEQTDGKAGYIYVPNTGVDGQNDLIRQFYGQRHMPGLVIDERWNGGGQIPTRFIELLNRPRVNYWARRDGKDWAWPPDSHQGPKVMLINGLAGSGGDAFPFYFRQAGLGKLVGTRTWGGLVGISGNPSLIDGGSIVAPTFGFYYTDGRWGIEGHGVDPDIEVIDDPALMVDGGDPQLDAAIEQILKEISERPYIPPQRPAYPDRRGMGIPEEER
ncbi:MAG: peptidase S41 [Phycisphaerales bacterium]|nr:MAG: peptidase S41 [Phycisphaerales bacterium]